MKRLALGVMLVTLLCGSAALTDQIGDADSYNGTFNITQTLSVNQFDPSLGMLNSVSLSVTVGALGNLGFENTDGEMDTTISTYYPWDPDTNTHGDLDLSLNSQSLAALSWVVMEDYNVHFEVFDGTYDFAGPSGFSTTYLDDSDGQNLFYTLPADLAAFLGTGSVDFDLAGTASSAMVMPGNGVSFVSTSGNASVEVIYDYTPVPEPATLVLLGCGALMLLRKRG
ncbi:MAG: PEP-CTERM sorting domain-containing protein [Planctomycetes bacterium]|nr:PEP-CTERM sorting domain-containing protein [Planctomycetota bacterium]